MTPGSVRGEEKSLEQAPVNRPEERMSLQDTVSSARYRKCGGRAKRNNPMGRPIPGPFPSTSEWLRPQRKMKKEKREASSLAAAPTNH